MGEHKLNERALAEATFPKFPPLGRDMHLELGASLLPKQNVLLMKPDDVQVIDGVTKVRATGDGGWVDVPEGAEVHVLGEPLPVEKCDVTVTIVCQYANVSVAGPNGRVPVSVTVLPTAIGRYDLRDFLKRCECGLPSGGLVVVP